MQTVSRTDEEAVPGQVQALVGRTPTGGTRRQLLTRARALFGVPKEKELELL
jgi:hypothetical protein